VPSPDETILGRGRSNPLVSLRENITVTTFIRIGLATIVAVFFTLVTGNAQSQGIAARALAITGVTVIDVDRGQRLVEHTVIIRNGRIAALGPTGSTKS
jgi:hypothetical protein